MNIYPIINSSLDILPDNLHSGQENISIVFSIEGDVTDTDRLGNPIRSTTSATVEGRAREEKSGSSRQQLPGTSNNYLPLRINVTKVDGTPTTSLPTTIAPKMAGVATYTQSNGRTVRGQFQVEPSLSKTVTKIHQKVGDIMYGKLEVMGDGA